MKKYTLKDLEGFERTWGGHGRICPIGNYLGIKHFGDGFIFPEGGIFAVGTTFGDYCQFDGFCRFRRGTSFGKGCTFGDVLFLGGEHTFENGKVEDGVFVSIGDPVYKFYRIYFFKSKKTGKILVRHDRYLPGHDDLVTINEFREIIKEITNNDRTRMAYEAMIDYALIALSIE